MLIYKYKSKLYKIFVLDIKIKYIFAIVELQRVSKPLLIINNLSLKRINKAN